MELLIYAIPAPPGLGVFSPPLFCPFSFFQVGTKNFFKIIEYGEYFDGPSFSVWTISSAELARSSFLFYD